MKTLLEIGAALNCGAPGRIAEQIGLLAMKEGWEVYHAHGLRHANPSQLHEIAVSTRLEENIHALHSFLLDRHGLASARGTRKLVEQIKEIKPDIIHLHNIHGYFCNFKVLFEYLDTITTPVIWTMHDCWPFTGRCFHFEGIGCNKWKTGCYECNAEKGYTVSPFYDRSKQLFELKKRLFSSVENLTLVPVSYWQASFLGESFLKKHPVEVIHNGVDLDKFFPMDGSRLREKYCLQNRFVILGVASPWNKRKGYDDFIQLCEVLPNDKFAIVLVGLNDEQKRKLPPNIIGITRTESQQELAEFYSMANVFCNMTYLDTFPTVNIEALACGTPVVTYKTGGSPEAVDSRTGIVVEQGNINAVAEAIKTMRKKPLDSKACRERAVACFDKDKQFNKYIELYERLIGLKGIQTCS